MRPTKLTEETISALETALMLGATIEVASGYAKISERTYYHWKAAAQAIYDRLDEHEKEYEAEREEARAEGKRIPRFKQLPLNDDEKALLQFLHTIMEAEAAGAVNHLNYINQAAPHDVKASIWLLENRYGYGRAKQIEVTGKDGGPLETKDVSDMTIEERAARIQAIIQTAVSRATDDSATDPT